MDLIQLQNPYNPDEYIQKYIRDVPPINVADVGVDNISSLFTGLGELFLSIFSLIKHREADFKERIQYTSLDRSYSRLILWHDTYQSMCSALHGDVPTNLADSVVGHLKDIGTTLTDRFIPLISKDFADLQVERLEKDVIVLRSRIEMVNPGDDDDSDSSSNFDYDSYTEIAEDLKTDTTCLIGLNSLMNHPSLEPPVVGAVSGDAVEQWELHQPYCDRISNRFPDGIESLISRLGKANYDRYLQWILRHSEVNDDGIDETEARHKANTVVVSAFHDSGLGSSVPSKSSYAETVMSYGADGNRQSVRVPPLSKEAKQGLPFTCVACSKTVAIKNNSLWKRHLYEDLCPWMCLDPECTSGGTIFSQRNDWLAHLSFEHQMAPAWASFECPLCRSDIEPGKISITRHLGGHLEEIALGSLPIQTDWDNENDEDSQTSISDEASREASPGKVNLMDPTFNMLPNEELSLPPMSKESGMSEEAPDASESCEICGFRPQGDPRWFKEIIIDHKRLQHALGPPKMYRCRYPGCTTVCARKDNRRRHEREKHSFVKSESAENVATGNRFDSVDGRQLPRKSKQDGSHNHFRLGGGLDTERAHKRRSGIYINGEKISVERRSVPRRERRSSPHVTFVEPPSPPPSSPNYDNPLHTQPSGTSTTYHDQSVYRHPEVRMEVYRPRRNSTAQHEQSTSKSKTSSSSSSSEEERLRQQLKREGRKNEETKRQLAEAKRQAEEAERRADAERKMRQDAERERKLEKDIKRMITAIDSHPPVVQSSAAPVYRKGSVSIKQQNTAPIADLNTTNKYYEREERRKRKEEDEQQRARLIARLTPHTTPRGYDGPTVVYHNRDSHT